MPFEVTLVPEVFTLQAEATQRASANTHSLGPWVPLSPQSSFAKCTICLCQAMVDNRGGLGYFPDPACKISGGVITGVCSGVPNVVGKVLGWQEEETTDWGLGAGDFF